MPYSISSYIGCSAAMVIGLMPALAFAQQQGTSAAAAEARAQGEDGTAVVIVTGVTQTTSKKNATFSINTISAEEMQRLAPISTADLLGNLPGIYAEGSTAGEAGNNITVRGLPVAGGFRFSPQLIDGLPAYEEPEVPFMNNDVLVRDDLMTEAVEAVKGGPGGILYSNGLGATVNHITRTGGKSLEAGYKIEYADYGFWRHDAFVSGPINDNLTGAIGGFYRRSDGLRDTGYTADQGGQVRGNLIFTSDNKRTTLRLDGHYLNDRTAFYQNLPISVPRFTQSGTPANPTVLNNDSIQPLGIDFGNGTTSSPYNRRFTMLGEYGSREIDQADGLHPNFRMFSAKASHVLDSGVKLSANLRHTGGGSGFNAVFTGNDTASASNFLNARYQNDVISPAHGAALNCNLDNAKLLGYFNVPANGACSAFANISREDFIRNYGKASSVQGRWTNDGSAVAGDAYLNFLIPYIAKMDASSTVLDLQAQKTFQAAGSHDVTFGVYGSRYTYDVNFQTGLLVGESAERSRLADLIAVDSNGQQVGPSLTLGGAILPGWNGHLADFKGDGRAVYLLDHWETMNKRLRIDAGVRYQSLDANVVRRNRETAVDLTPSNVVVGSTGDTTADNEVFFPSAARTLKKKFDAVGWSIGANYSINRPLSVYALASSSFRLPSVGDLVDLSAAGTISANGEQVDIDAVERIRQYEAGVRYMTREFGSAIAVFYNKFSPRSGVNIYRDIESSQCSAIGGVTQINSCPEVAQLYKRGVENVGAEVELTYRPRFVDGLELKGNFLVQQPKVEGANYTFTQEDKTPDGVITGYHYVQVSEDGRRPRRLAKFMANFTPSYDLRALTGLPLTIYGQYQYTGDRFSEATDTNVTLLPSYSIINLGAQYEVTPRLMAQVHVANLRDSLTFTEGDPLFNDLLSPDGTRNRGVARPLFGRTIRASLTYRF
jgi:outer membrane receptor protein involved in Fe transport